jgi:hypothetical protein
MTSRRCAAPAGQSLNHVAWAASGEQAARKTEGETVEAAPGGLCSRDIGSEKVPVPEV